MTDAPRRLSPGDCQARLASWAGCAEAAGGVPGETERVVADYLRQALCQLGREDAGPLGAVHAHRLLAVVRRQLAGWIPEPEGPPWALPVEAGEELAQDPDEGGQTPGVRDVALRALRRLTLVGDCAHRGEGHYLATPPRLVALPSGRAIVLGSLPTRTAADSLGVELGWAGFARGVSSERFSAASDRVPRQGLDAWLGWPALPLEQWTAGVLDEARGHASPCPKADAASFEVYAPHLLGHQGQRYRWTQATAWRVGKSTTSQTLSLCRSRGRPRRFWLAPLVETLRGATYDRERTVPPAAVRRLMYGLDQLAGATNSARALAVVGGLRGEREVRVYNWPAHEEYRLLAALCYDVTPPEGPFLPLRYRVAPEWWPDARAVLEGLRVQVNDETGADS